MSRVSKSIATLCIRGDDLFPGEITELLQADPDFATAKGESVVARHSGSARIAKTGLWNLESSDQQPADLDLQIREVLSRTTSNIEVWRSLSKKYRVSMSCGLFVQDWNQQLNISPESLEALGIRGIQLELDIYEGCEEEREKLS